jgi:glycosyltransferase involved in cell wall biosynthesis
MPAKAPFLELDRFNGAGAGHTGVPYGVIVPNRIHVTGSLSKSELYAVLQRADAAVLPSQVDNLPNTVIESLMFGIPVIGSRERALMNGSEWPFNRTGGCLRTC